MPKFPKNKSALKRTRELLLLSGQNSETEEEVSSDCSEEYSHIPLHTEIPLLSSLFIDNTNAPEENMEQVTMDINSLVQMMHNLAETQKKQQDTLNALLQTNQSGINGASPAQQNVAMGNIENLFKIPDPIKAIPRFDGNRKQLSAWLSTAENTLNVFKTLVTDCQFNIYTTAVINKIEGKAKDIICLAGNPQKFDDIKVILTSALGDRQELTYYKSQLWQNKMKENMTVHKYYNRCKEIVQNIKSLAKQKPKYRDNWDAINAFIEEDALAAFLAGLKEPYFGYAQAAGPEDMEAAYAFVCKFKSKEETASQMENFKQPKYYQNRESKENRSYENKNQNTFRKPQYQQDYKNKTEKSDTVNDPQPMELGSTKSRITLNKKQIHNNELSEDEKSSHSESEDENIDVNFCWVQQGDNRT